MLPCNIESMTGKAAAKWCAQTWMGGWDVPSEVITDSGKEYTSDWWRELCTRLGLHQLRCEIHSHRALSGERAGRSLMNKNMLRKELASEKDFHWLKILFALLRRYHNTPLYRGLSPNEIVFGRTKVGRYLRELGMPPLTMQEKGLTKGTSCSSYCPMSDAS